MQLNAWRNSIHVHMLALTLGVIAALTAVSVGLLYLIDLPDDGRAISVYEMARLVQGLPLSGPPGDLEVHTQSQAPAAPTNDVDRRLSVELAKRLKRAPDDVRVIVEAPARWRGRQIAREVALYGPDGAADPTVWETFTVAIRRQGGWLVIHRPTPGNDWRISLWYSLALGLILILPLSFWFSARLARPIKAFAASAEQLRAHLSAAPIDVAGPSEIRQAARSLNDMQARLLRFVRERTTLTAAIAHDLRAPLSRLHIRLAAAPAQLREAAEADIDEMERMIKVILDFVEHEMRPIAMEPLDLSLLIEGIVDDLADQGRSVTLVESEPITTVGDPLLLKRLFSNVIENALKFSGAAAVSVAQRNSEALITITDQGPGMDEADIARAFEPFYRGEPSRSRKTGGVGLGLTIAKNAVEAHGGAIRLINNRVGGLVAEIVLPIHELGSRA